MLYIHALWPNFDQTRVTVAAKQTGAAVDRTALMEQHRAARAKRDAAALDSDEYRAAAEEIARIEITIARLEEPPTKAPPKG
jgi:hypothetical protein